MDYYKIGEQVRKYRKANGLSQEQLAEKIGISVTHMSHIETGNTKLSLPVFVDLAKTLQVQTDDLLGEKMPDRKVVWNELTAVFESCTAKQLRILVEIAKAAKISMDKYDEEKK